MFKGKGELQAQITALTGERDLARTELSSLRTQLQAV